MSKISVSGSPTGTATFDIVAPATSTNRTITLPDASGQVSVLDLRAAQTATGTAVDFLNIPATARRITVMLDGVSTNGTSLNQIQLGSVSIQTTGYTGAASSYSGSISTVNYSSGALLHQSITAAFTQSGAVQITNLTGNVWVFSGGLGRSDGVGGSITFGSVTLSGPLDRIRITTVNGTDQFDAGSVSILVE